MRPLVLDDLLPLEEYAGRRREFFESHQRYLDRYRRVRLGPRLTLLFENRQTLWYRVQELLRVARLSEPEWVQRELDVCNRSLPSRDQLQAALVIAVEDETRLAAELAPWQDLNGDALRLCVGPRQYPARLVTCRPEDRCVGAAHWVQFPLDGEARQLLADFRLPAWIAAAHASYRHDSERLNEDVRQSLLDDLELSDRDGQAA
jgi:hypothetical protein